MLAGILTSIVTDLAGSGAVAISKKVYAEAIAHGIIKANVKFNFGGYSLVEKYSYDEATKAAKDIAGRIRKDKFNPSIIVGIGRGGAIFGSLVSYNLGNTPILMLDRKYSWQTDVRKDDFYFDVAIPDEYLGHVLIVAGEIHSGNTMKMFYDHLKAKGAESIRCCAFYRQIYPEGKKVAITADYYGVSGQAQPLMPWQDADYIRDSLSAKKKWKAPSKRIIIVRHGQTELNARDIFIGSRTEVPLSETGRRQALDAGKKIREIIGDQTVHILTSPQDRCIETSMLIKKAFGKKRADMSELSELRERDFGIWEGMERFDIARQDHALYDEYDSGSLDCTPEGAETMREVIARAEKAKEAILSCDAENILVVTHNTTGRVLICSFTGVPYSDYRSITLDNAAPYVLQSSLTFRRLQD